MSTGQRITQDGAIYRWEYTLSREQSMVHFRLMVRICAAVSAVLSLILLIALRDEMAILVILAIWGFVLGLPALIGYAALNHDTRAYEMDAACIRQKNASRGGDAVIRFAKVREWTIRGNAFVFKEGITTYTVYVPQEDAAFVKQYIEEHSRTEAVS